MLYAVHSLHILYMYTIHGLVAANNTERGCACVEVWLACEGCLVMNLKLKKRSHSRNTFT